MPRATRASAAASTAGAAASSTADATMEEADGEAAEEPQPVTEETAASPHPVLDAILDAKDVLAARLAAKLDAELEELPLTQLAAALHEIESVVAERRKTLKAHGHDPMVEMMVEEAARWVERKVSTATLRTLCSEVRLVTGKTAFSEDTSDMGLNVEGAEFDIQWLVGRETGHCRGQAIYQSEVQEAAVYEGCVESSLFGDHLLEDSLLEDINWLRVDQNGNTTAEILSRSAIKWREAAGLSHVEISWQDTARAVAAGALVLTQASEQNEDRWVCRFLASLFENQLHLLPGSLFADAFVEDEHYGAMRTGGDAGASKKSKSRISTTTPA